MKLGRSSSGGTNIAAGVMPVVGRLLQQNVVSIFRRNPETPGRESEETVRISQNGMKSEKETAKSYRVRCIIACNISVPRIPYPSLIEFHCKMVPLEEFITVTAYGEGMKKERKMKPNLSCSDIENESNLSPEDIQLQIQRMKIFYRG
jgi:hypothetical protein